MAGRERRPAAGRRGLVIGIGNRDRGDDAVGPVVCDLVRRLSAESAERGLDVGLDALVFEGSVVDLPLHWHDGDTVTIVDASAPAGHPGRVRRVDALDQRLVAPRPLSTHSIDVGAAIELARALDRLPAALDVIGIEGRSFDAGGGLSPEVARTAARVAAALTRRARRAVAAR
jgi:hydrogenase maturation protease